MIVNYIKPSPVDETTHPRIIMQPENDHDRVVLDKIVANKSASGCGYDPRSQELIHVEVLIAT